MQPSWTVLEQRYVELGLNAGQITKDGIIDIDAYRASRLPILFIDLPPVVVPVPMLVEPSLRLPAGAAGA